VAALAGVGGCSSADPSPYGEAVHAYCEGLCRGFGRCGLTGSSCEVRCNSDPDAYPSGLRVDAARPLGECLSREDCSVLAGQHTLAPCFDQLSQTLPLTQALVDYCESAALNYYECDSFGSVDDCASQMILWADKVLTDALLCHMRPCDEMRDCEDATFGAYQ
jgi:hypothetical protein